MWQIWSKGDKNLSALMLNTLTEKTISESFHNVYYSAEEIIRHQLAQYLECFYSPIEESQQKVIDSHFAQQLVLHMVYRDLKEYCTKLWPKYTHVCCAYFLPHEPWHYCLFRTDFGENVTYSPPITGEWLKLKSMASQSTSDIVPNCLLMRPFLLWIWCILCPYRTLTPVVNNVFCSLVQCDNQTI